MEPTAVTPTPSRGYRAMLAASLLTSAVAVVFFVIGLGDGTVSSFNAGLWSALLLVCVSSVGGGRWLAAQGRPRLALLALSVTAVPGVIGVSMLLLVLLSGGRWN